MDYFLDLMNIAMMHPILYIIVTIISINISILQWLRVRRNKKLSELNKKLAEQVAIENKKV